MKCGQQLVHQMIVIGGQEKPPVFIMLSAAPPSVKYYSTQQLQLNNKMEFTQILVRGFIFCLECVYPRLDLLFYPRADLPFSLTVDYS